ncbi:MAG: S-layer homology domain-containing protein [Lachnospiraceae bacterium]
MKRKMMKFLSLFLSVSMAINMFTVPVFAAPEDEGAAAEQSAVIEDDAVENVENGIEQENEEDVSNGAESDAAPAEETSTEETPAEDAEPEEAPKRETISVEENYKAFTVNANDIEITVDGEGVIVLGAGEEPAEVDTSSPTISVVEEELNNIRVLNDEGEIVALTEEQIGTIVYMYGLYQDQWKEHADLLGVQMPFFLQYNDDGEDGLGTLGEMLVLAGHTVDEVRSGEYKYDDLIGMIQNFYYADQLGVKYYGDEIAAARDEVLNKVKESGAQTVAQKLLIINDWLAHKATFDMSYIMNMGEDEPVMVAENPQKHVRYDDVYNTMYAVYEEQITKQFHDQIYDGIVAQLRQQYYEGAIKNIVYQQSLGKSEDEATDEEKQAASDQADAFMKANADAISEDAAGFVEENFGEEAAAQLSAGADEFIADAEENGVEVDPENAPGYKMTVEEITQNTMANEKIVDLDGDGENETTANDAIPIYAKQAAEGLTQGILGAWEGNHIGILSGYNTGVCCGYAKAFAYLVQYMMPEKYGVDGAGTDMSVASNWKTADELYYDDDGKLDIGQDYAVDLVRVTFQTDVTMYGEVNEGFNSDHFWNAVKVDGKWYYIDPCYIDVYTEVMSRDRVEIDGNMNHMYFMFSHDTAKDMYEDYMPEDGIKTLYAEVATDKSYEDSWYARIASNAYSDGTYFYYLYDSSDMFGLMREMNQGSNGEESNDTDYEKFMEMTNAEYKLVRHTISDNDIAEGGSDSDYEALIEFNHKVSEDDDDDTTVARVNVNGEMVANELLTELFAQFKEECDIYPSIAISTALYNGKLYFNLSNCILSYDLSSGAVEKVKEYNTVYGARDNTKAFGGMAFSVVDSADEATHTVENHPIASMTIKDDGNMYVSIATSFAYISGKDPHNCADSENNGYGYEFEESNYNPDYSTYFNMDDISEQYEGFDTNSQDNDNDEFMWSAVFVDTLSMEHLAGSSHNYSQVTVEPFCGRDGFTENRCTTCGAIEAGTRVEEEGTACDHHYIHFDETYYTKDDDGNWNTGDCYVCTICGSAVSKPVEPTQNSQETDEEFAERQEQYEKDKEEYEAIVANAGHVYTTDAVEWSEDEAGNPVATIKAGTKVTCDPCEGKELDVLQGEKTSVNLDEDTVLTEITKTSTGTCDEGLSVTCTATGTGTYTEEGTAVSIKLSASNTEQKDADEHNYVAEFTWTPKDTASETSEEELEADAAEEETDEPDTQEVPYTVTAIFKCDACGATIEEGIDVTVTVDKENSKAPTCAEEGKTVYVATATAKGENGDVIATGTGTKEDAITALSHEYVGDFTWTEIVDDEGKGTGEYTATADVKCANCDKVFGEDVDAVVTEDTENNKTESCTAAGVRAFKATATVTIGEGEDAEEVTVKGTKEVEVPALGHSYTNEFQWNETTDTDGNKSYTATADIRCERGDVEYKAVEAVVVKDKDASVAATCTKTGTDVFIATATVYDENNEIIVEVTDTKEDVIPALGHELKGEFKWTKSQDTYEATATSVTVTCTHDCGTEFIVSEPETVKDEERSKAATRKEEGVNVFVATAVVKDQDGKEIGTVTDTKKILVPALGNPFVDVAEDTYYYDAVLWAYDNGITSGKDETHFQPNGDCNRAQVVTFLWRVMGEPEPEITENPFVDVSEDAYYYKAVLWAYDNGITSGKDATHFQPNAIVTRAQFVTFLYRNEGEPQVKMTDNPFEDVAEDQYYYNAVLWAYENDITQGKDDTHFLPGGNCKRCQVVTFLYRAYGEEK